MLSRAARRVKGWSAALLVLAVPDAARAQLPAAAREDWVQVDTPHLTVFSNGGVRAAARVGRRIERLAEVLERTTHGLVLWPRTPVLVYVFRNRESFDPYCPGNAGAYFVQQFGANYLALEHEEREYSMLAAQHEFIHCMLTNSLPGHPRPWFNEGLAEFYSNVHTDRRTAEIGRVVQQNAFWIRTRDGKVPLRRLLSLSADVVGHYGGPRQAAFYASAWGLVHFLIMTDRDDRFSRYLTSLRDGADPDSAFAGAFGANLDSLEREVSSYLDRRTLPYMEIAFTEDLESVQYESRSMTEAEIHYRLGALIAHQDRRVAGGPALLEEHMVRASALDPANAAAVAILGVAHQRAAQAAGTPRERELRRAAADSCYERAMALEPRDPIAYLWAATNAMTEWGSTDPVYEPQDSTPTLLLRARAVAARGLAAIPGHPRLSALYGGTFVVDRHVPPDAIGAAMDAAQAMPRDADVLTILLILTCNNDNPAAAHSLFRKRLKGIAGPERRRFVAVVMARAEIRCAKDLVHEGRTSDAVSMLERAVAAAEHLDARRMLEGALLRVREH